MMFDAARAMLGSGLVLALCVAASGADATSRDARHKRVGHPLVSQTLAPALGSFTPAAADPRLAATFARGGLSGGSGFQFTPSSAPGHSRRVTVAVRARAATPGEGERVALAAINPYAYNLGVAVGWRRFAVTGDIAKVDLGPVPGGRESADLALSYAGGRWSTRLALGADRALGNPPHLIGPDRNVSVDLGGSYSINTRLDVTGGVRYRMDHDRLDILADDRRDSQAVYVGTAFRF